ncbi:hypothetical protein GCM10010390_85790 [Streptomyces mordarskii]|uniref:Uncharacterized protein n=1 Tax=Streptomyces mordarskii TaxID=1226758 RepID=A0ABN1ENP4_9ACTN
MTNREPCGRRAAPRRSGPDRGCLSTQQIRNYVDPGVLPPAARTPAGYRLHHYLTENRSAEDR